MRLKRKRATKTMKHADNIYFKSPKKDLPCSQCETMVYEVGGDIRSVICSYCTMAMVPPPIAPKPKTAGEKKPRGWHLKRKYVSPSGVEYSFGKEVSKNDGRTD